MELSNVDKECPILNVLTTIDPILLQSLKWEIKGFGCFYHSNSVTSLSQIFGPLDGFKFMLKLSKQTFDILQFQVISLSGYEKAFGTLKFEINMSGSTTLETFDFDMDFQDNSTFRFQFDKSTVQKDFTLQINMLYVGPEMSPDMKACDSDSSMEPVENAHISETSSLSGQEHEAKNWDSNAVAEILPKISTSVASSFEVVSTPEMITPETKSPVEEITIEKKIEKIEAKKITIDKKSEKIETEKKSITAKKPMSSFSRIIQEARLPKNEKFCDSDSDNDIESDCEEISSRPCSPIEENQQILEQINASDKDSEETSSKPYFSTEDSQLTPEQIKTFRIEEFMDSSDDDEIPEEQTIHEEFIFSDDYESSDGMYISEEEQDPVNFDDLKFEAIEENESNQDDTEVDQTSYLEQELPKFIGDISDPKLIMLTDEFWKLRHKLNSHLKWIISEYVNGDSHVMEDMRRHDDPINDYIEHLDKLVNIFREIESNDDEYIAYLGRLNEWFETRFKNLDTIEEYIKREVESHCNLVNQVEKLRNKMDTMTRDLSKLDQTFNSNELVQAMLSDFEELQIEFEEKVKAVSELMVPTIVCMETLRLNFVKLQNLIYEVADPISQKLSQISASIDSFVDDNMTDLINMEEDRLLECRQHLDDFLNQINSAYKSSNEKFDTNHEKCRKKVRKLINELDERIEPWNHFQESSATLSEECQEIRTMIQSFKGDQNQTKEEKLELLTSLLCPSLKNIKKQIRELRRSCTLEYLKSNVTVPKASEEVNRLTHKHRVLTERCNKLINELN